MDRELGVLHGHEYDDLKQVGGAVRSDDQPTVGVFAGVFDDKRMVNGVLDVADLDAVLCADSRTSTEIAYYEKTRAMFGLSASFSFLRDVDDRRPPLCGRNPDERA